MNEIDKMSFDGNYSHITVDQLMFAAINVCVFAKQTSSLLLMFVVFCQED